tara:strand:+ start:2018 stop:2503 length:486 start_codon:yes stop_codon:yes gene_type:complete
MEILDIINQKKEIIGKAPRNEIYAKKLPHKIVHTHLFNKKGELALQLRGPKSTFCPFHWGPTSGGHVASGELNKDAALREFKEELGTSSSIVFQSEDWYEYNGLKKLLISYKAEYEGPFTLEPGKVEKVEFFSLPKIKEMIDSGEKFHPELLFLLKTHFFK